MMGSRRQWVGSGKRKAHTLGLIMALWKERLGAGKSV